MDSKENFYPILQKYLILTQALTFFNGGAKMSQVCHAGQLQPAKFYSYNLLLQHQKGFSHY